MGPLCESLSSLYGSRGGAASMTWENMRDFVESACSRVLSNNIFVESTYLVASSSLLLPRPPFRTSPEAFARNVGTNNPSMVFVSANQLEAMTLGSAVELSSTPTLPLLLDSVSFADVLSTMNPMTVSKMQLQRLQEIVDSGFGFKRANLDDIHESVEDAAGPSFMQQYAALLAAKKVQDEIKEATELVANLGHAVRQRASELLLEGPLLSLKEGIGEMMGGLLRPWKAAKAQDLRYHGLVCMPTVRSLTVLAEGSLAMRGGAGPNRLLRSRVAVSQFAFSRSVLRGSRRFRDVTPSPSLPISSGS